MGAGVDDVQAADLACARVLAVERGFDPDRIEARDVAFVLAGGWFDPEAAEHVCGFVRCLPHTKGRWRGQPFNLLAWQQSYLERLFGWKRPDGTRKYRRSLLFVGKKNGKSELCAAIALYLLLASGERAAEVFLGARDRWQAAIIFGTAADMVRMRPALARRVEIVESRKVLAVKDAGARLECLSADVEKSEGINASALIVDELHVVARKLMSAIRYSSAAREQPLMLALTTAGVREPGAVGWEWYEHACQVRDGLIEDDEFLPCLYEADASMAWDSDEAVRAANPSLGTTVALEEFHASAAVAATNPSERLDYERYRLNRWVSQTQRWLPLETWDASIGHAIDLDDYRGATAWGGLDIASVSDLSALAWLMPCPHDPLALDVFIRCWVPEAGLERSPHAAAYRQWREQGFLVATPGAATDHRFITEAVRADAGVLLVDSLSLDRLFQGLAVSQLLEDEGVKVFGAGMGFLTLSPLVAELERLVLEGRLHHAGNPVLRWAVDCCELKLDAIGNRKPVRDSKNTKIDALIATLLALDRWARRLSAPVVEASVYLKRGVLSLEDYL